MANGQLNEHRFNVGHTEIVICFYEIPTQCTPTPSGSCRAIHIAVRMTFARFHSLLSCFGTFDPHNKMRNEHFDEGIVCVQGRAAVIGDSVSHLVKNA